VCGSPPQQLGEYSHAQVSTAIGRIADDQIWQADERFDHAWRRRVGHRTDARRVPIAHPRDSLDLAAADARSEHHPGQKLPR
jgi:hypothetical protein